MSLRTLLFGLTLAFAPLVAQTPAAPVSPAFTFDIVSVKPAAPDERGGMIKPDPGYQTYICQNTPLELVMTVAYGVTARQIEGGPGWIQSDRWDITAKADHPGTIDQLHAALAKALEDRFQLKVTHITKQESVLDLEVAPGGAKLTVHDPPNDTHNEPIGIGPAPNQPDTAELSVDNAPMDYFAFSLARLFNQGVINKTGLDGRYDIKVDFPFQRPRRQISGVETGAPAPPDFSPLIAALPKQVGLQLVHAKGPVEYLHIDSVAKPTAN